MQKVTLIPGDGIGPEVTEATVEVLDAAPHLAETLFIGLAAFISDDLRNLA